MHAADLIHCSGYLGRFVNIIKSRNSKNSNRSGTVVNETMNMLYLINQESNSVIRIPKSEICKFEIHHSSGTYTMGGKRLLDRPEELVNILK